MLKKLNDPRYFILLFLFSFVIFGQIFLGFFQKWDAIAASVFSATVTEVLLVKVIRNKWIFPLSALISGVGISLLISSYLIWPYILTGLLAIGFKHAIRINGSHLFNPNNVAIVFMLYFLPQYAVSTPKQWTNGITVMVFILVLGLLAAYMAKRLDTVVAFTLGFVGLAAIRHWFLGEPFYFAFGPLLGASFQLFTFFMITDPKTTPPTSKARICFALLIALVDAYLRIHSITNSLFYASFLVTLFVGLPYRWYRAKIIKQ